ncbi:hypothetical protein JJJ17_05390 [Paracoccus caeni]|uniref:DUF3617 family protein n=1 Tax=Paracoccus caeni TaxID=657651 RepID=A0A934VU23_9RHOB|nr:hypothetical protein [Paracoccus caeni]MBK4215356.1 hypothetical protein [Paracoccus caeni]
MAGPSDSTLPVVDGVYNLDAAECGNQNSMTRLRVQGDTFRFYESECTFGRKGGQPNASEGTLMCLGEGQRFNRDIRMEAQANVLRIIENDAKLDYSRCPA